MSRRVLPYLALFLVGLAALAYFARTSAVEYGARDLTQDAQERLRLISATLSTSIERFRYLPEVVARSREIEELLEPGADIAQRQTANLLLARIANASGAMALFFTDTTGLTIASSNYNTPGSFVGQNYGYRPYFRDALEKDLGSYYAVGATTGQPGYFLATPIRVNNATVGVAIVKIDLLPVEQQWRDAGETVAMMDNKGVTFLSSRPEWRYASMSPIGAHALKQLSSERRYGELPKSSLKNVTDTKTLSLMGSNGCGRPFRLGLTVGF